VSNGGNAGATNNPCGGVKNPDIGTKVRWFSVQRPAWKLKGVSVSGEADSLVRQGTHPCKVSQKIDLTETQGKGGSFNEKGPEKREQRTSVTEILGCKRKKKRFCVEGSMSFPHRGTKNHRSHLEKKLDAKKRREKLNREKKKKRRRRKREGT